MSSPRRVLLVGVDQAPPAPFCFGLPGSEHFRGFEVDLLNELARGLDVTLRFTSALWSQILADLEAGRLDLVCAAATITDERRRVVDFSDSYFEGNLALVGRRNRMLASPDVPPDWTVGVRVATVASDVVQTRWPGRCVRTFDLNVDLYDALRDGRVDAAVDDRPIAEWFARNMAGLALGPSIPGTGFGYGIVFAKGNDQLRTEVNAELARLRADGSLHRLRQRWISEPS